MFGNDNEPYETPSLPLFPRWARTRIAENVFWYIPGFLLALSCG